MRQNYHQQDLKQNGLADRGTHICAPSRKYERKKQRTLRGLQNLQLVNSGVA
jgi:hypothetical protein